MSEERLPQYNRFIGGNGVEFYETLFRLVDISRQCVVPAIVEEVHEDGRVSVRPLVNTVYDTPEGAKSEPRQRCKVPTLQFMHGGYSLYTPLFSGDTGYLVAGDRNADTAIEKNSTALFKPQGDEYGENEGPKDPDDGSLLNFDNGFFIPCSWANPIGTVDEGLRFRHTNKDGEVDFEFNLKDGTITVKAEHYHIHGEADFYDDCHFHKSVTIDEDLDVGNDASIVNNALVGNILTVKKDVDIGEEAHAHLREVRFVTGYDNEREEFTTWKGVVVASDGEDGEPIPFEGGGGGGGEEKKFHFKPTFSDGKLSVGRGVVNVGGMTYQFSGASNITLAGQTNIVCASVDITLGSQRTMGIAVYGSYSQLNTAQSDYTKYIFPLYEVSQSAVTIDFRPMPNAGCWE